MDFSYSGASSDYEVVKEHVLPTIKEALKFIRNQAFEVDFYFRFCLFTGFINFRAAIKCV